MSKKCLTFVLVWQVYQVFPLTVLILKLDSFDLVCCLVLTYGFLIGGLGGWESGTMRCNGRIVRRSEDPFTFYCYGVLFIAMSFLVSTVPAVLELTREVP